MNGTCVCHPGFGDSFVHIELKPAEGDLYGIRIPTDFDLNPIPGCGYDAENDAYNDLFRGPKPADPVTGLPAMPVCEPIYVADCGDMFYTLLEQTPFMARRYFWRSPSPGWGTKYWIRGGKACMSEISVRFSSN